MLTSVIIKGIIKGFITGLIPLSPNEVITSLPPNDPAHYQIALKEVGTKEFPGKKSNPRVEMYFKSTKIGTASDDVPWCAAFVAWCLEQAGIASTKAANARSYLNWGKATTNPRPGDIVVFWRESKSSWKGHVGFFVGFSGDNVMCLGGNQSNAVNISPYPKRQVLGYRTLSTMSSSKTIVAAAAAGTLFSVEPLYAAIQNLSLDQAEQLKQFAATLPEPYGSFLHAAGIALTGYIILERVRKIFRLGV